MSGLEASIAGTDTHMLGELSYSLPPSAQFVQKRESVFWSSGANTYTPTGIRTLRVNLSGQGWLDCSSLVIEADVNELGGTNALQPLVGGMEAFFQSLRVSIQGTIIEDIGDASCSYGRIHNMLQLGLPQEKIRMNAGMGFELDANGVPESIPAGGSKKILHKPLAGLCHQKVFLPLTFVSTAGQGLSLEFQMISDGTEAVDTQNSGSSTFSLSNVKCYGEILRMDSSMDETFARHLMSGKKIRHPDAFIHLVEF